MRCMGLKRTGFSEWATYHYYQECASHTLVPSASDAQPSAMDWDNVMKEMGTTIAMKETE